ncbi:hypothetical protein ACFOZ1_15275 [Gracilibacillus marinus]|uniref:DUF3168 domain-containing protein n=1 Tax=Gracilibacillus marinus TaxID=630535 RepID=A0ABV8VYZ3_9BACI
MTEVIRELVIRKTIEAYLSDVTTHIYYENAPVGIDEPYIVYVLGDSIDDGSLEDMELEVNGWHNPINGDSTPLATLIGQIDNRLHRSTHQSDGVFFSIYRDRRVPVSDPDKRLRRRQILYQIRVMGVGM